MAYFDQPFVEVAFVTMLARNADPTGLRYYTRRLRLGYSRISVLDQLVRSPEFLRPLEEVQGLKEAIDEYRASRRVTRWRTAIFDPELGRTPAARRTRSLQNRIGGERQVLEKGLDQLKVRHAKIEQIIDDISEVMRKDKQANSLDENESSSPFQIRARRVDEVREQDLPKSSRAVLSKIRL